jgi:2,3-bisphosphoglycerate-independent phosphoglycerate mutase
VPVILVSDDAGKYRLREGGSLRDISPTLLGMLNLDKPGRMTGGDLRVEVSGNAS